LLRDYQYIKTNADFGPFVNVMTVQKRDNPIRIRPFQIFFNQVGQKVKHERDRVAASMLIPSSDV
jgi:hypothetical protein